MGFERKCGYLVQGLCGDLSARVLDSCRSQERRTRRMLVVLSHGAHLCALPIHIRRKRPCLFSATLITDSFESGHQRGGGGVLVYSKWRTRLRLQLRQTSPCTDARAELWLSRCFAEQTGGSGEELSVVR